MSLVNNFKTYHFIIETLKQIVFKSYNKYTKVLLNKKTTLQKNSIQYIYHVELFLYLHQSPKVHSMNTNTRSKTTYLVVF